MPRGRPRAKASNSVSSNSLLEALKFIAFVTKDIGPINETHVLLNNNQAVAYNGILAAGCKITEDIQACPHNNSMIDALSKCGQNLNITQLDNRLSIKSDKFRAFVSCIPMNVIEKPCVGINGDLQPDNPIGLIDDRFKKALEVVSIVPEDNAHRIVGLSILMNGYSLIATDGKIIIEYWHGIDLPSNLAIPKEIIQPLLKINKKLVKFGFSQSSVTFWFEDESWIRTQLYAEAWPSISHIMNIQSDPKPFAADLFEGLAAVASFSADGMVRFTSTGISSHADINAGAFFELEGLVPSLTWSIRHLSLLKGLATVIDWNPSPGMLTFQGENCRGIIAGCK